MPPDVWRRLLPTYLLFVIAFPLGMLLAELPRAGVPSLCLFRAVTHLDCPGCGLTRAFRAMGRLQVGEAFGYNPLGPPLFLFATGLWGFCLTALLSRGRVPIPGWWTRWRRHLFYGGVALYLCLGFARMAVEIAYPATRLPDAGTVWTLPTLLRK
jgi:hypothetical protein